MKHYSETKTGKDLREHFAPYAAPEVTVNFANYREFLKDMDMTEDQKAEFLQALWDIVTGFVELGFGTHPTQEAGGQNPEIPTFSTSTNFNLLSSEDNESNDKKGEPHP
ncbi:MAG: hypothetical protein NXH91_17160 [Phyllobacteriaceae bacterium]|nr:hypothetical protein [Phyllobacteriaceae bacterium]